MAKQRVELTRRLIAHRSVSDETSRPIADWVSNTLADAGFRIEQHVYRVKGVEKVNVVAVKGGEGRPALAFSGHLDTVSYNEREWSSNPLDLVERDGRFYGRGTCDMKGFIALAMEVGMRMPARELRRPFGLIFTSDEEVGCVGVRRLVERREPLAENIVIGEPTNLVPFILHKGYIYVRIWLRGVGGHSSDPDKGKNVVMLALPHVLARLNELRDALRNVRDDRFAVPFATLNVGVVTTNVDEKTGKKTSEKNIIAKECYIDLDVRPLPGQDVDETVRALREHVARDGSLGGVQIEVHLARAPTPPFETKPASPIVTSVEEIFGNRATSTSFNTEGGVLNKSGCTCVVCGLGSIEQAHQADEFVEASFFKDDVANKYEALVRRFCCEPIGRKP
jgi:acetylornithine deacetylase